MQMEQVVTGRIRARYGVVLIVALLSYVFLSVTFYLGAGWDDMFLTLWQGENLAAGHGFVNYNHERVEISSSLLHTLIIALVSLAAPEHTFLWNKALGLIAGAVCLSVIYAFRGTILGGAGRFQYPAYAAVMAYIASCPCFLYWNLGGLEAPYVALLLTLYGVLLDAHWRRPDRTREIELGLVASLFVLTRPEGFYLAVFGILHAVLFLALRGGRPTLWIHPALPAAAFLAVTAWRLAYLDAAFPNPVYAKSGFLVERILDGLDYVRQFAVSSWLMSACFLLVLLRGLWLGGVLLRAGIRGVRPPVERFEGLFPIGLIVTVILVVVVVGGDWMEFFRFLAPLAPLLLCVSASLVRRGFDWVTAARGNIARGAVCGIIAAVLFFGFFYNHLRQDGLNRRRQTGQEIGFAVVPYLLPEVFGSWENLQRNVMRTCFSIRRDMDALEPVFQDELPTLYAEAGRLVIVTRQMGFFPYTLKEFFPGWKVRFVDLSGLTDPFVARVPLRRNMVALRGALQIPSILAGDTPILSEYVRKWQPNMVYTMGLALDMDVFTANMEDLGFECVRGRPGGYVYYRPD